MANSRPTASYKISQAELYAICTIGWQSYAENQPAFEAFNTLYTAQFGTDASVEVEAAKNLPDFQARNQETEIAYILMGQTSDQSLSKWRALRSYIRSSFPPELQKPNIEAAGEDHYSKAMYRKWAETELMLTSAITFLTDNAATLTAGGMPATFPTEMTALQTAFMGYYSTFTDSGQDEHEGTDAKINANNTIYDHLQSMFEVGQIIFENAPAKRERFIFSRVKELITNRSSSGGSTIPADTVELGMYVFDADTLLPIQGATLSILNAPGGMIISAVSNAEGIINLKITGFTPNETAFIEGELSAEGYQTSTGDQEVTAGNYYSIESEMLPEVMEE